MKTDIRMRSRIRPEHLEDAKGKVLPETSYDVLLSGPTTVARGDGKLLAIYLPGALSPAIREASYAILHEMRKQVTHNRGLASGALRQPTFKGSLRGTVPAVSSVLAGGFDPMPRVQYCRLTAWTNSHNAEFAALFPLFEEIDGHFAREVPDRYEAQARYIAQTHPDWRIGRTVFTTITVNNSYPTGVHTDKGDLDEGFSTLAVLRRGEYTGGTFVFPEYRLGVDMQDGDLLLMDAHEWHGNTYMECGVCFEGIGSPEFYPSHEGCITPVREQRGEDGALEIVMEAPERISIVSYFRTKMTTCGSAAEEVQRAYAWAERVSLAGVEAMSDDELVEAFAVAEMAAESR